MPSPEDVSKLRLIDRDTGEVFTFHTRDELSYFKYQRYLKRYLRTIHSIDESVGRLLDWLDDAGQCDNTIVVYTSDQGFFLGEHGQFDKRFMHEESFQMPFIMLYPKNTPAGTICDDILYDVDFAPTLLDYADLPIPNYMQGRSAREVLKGITPKNWPRIAYHRHWMHRDPDHNAYSHYGIRDQRFKLIYWYNDGFDLPGSNTGGQDKEWELFDCKKDPLELFKVFDDPSYIKVKEEMLHNLKTKMAVIGDEPTH